MGEIIIKRDRDIRYRVRAEQRIIMSNMMFEERYERDIREKVMERGWVKIKEIGIKYVADDIKFKYQYGKRVDVEIVIRIIRGEENEGKDVGEVVKKISENMDRIDKEVEDLWEGVYNDVVYGKESVLGLIIEIMEKGKVFEKKVKDRIYTLGKAIDELQGEVTRIKKEVVRDEGDK